MSKLHHAGSPEENIYLENGHTDELSRSRSTDEYYPPKPWPEEVPRKNQTVRFIGSLLLFGGFYYFFVSKDIEIITWLAVIVLIHELGHYFAMKFFRYEDLSIFFLPLIGAVAGGSKEKISQKEKAIVLLAGPLPGVVFGVGLFLFASHQGNYSMLRLAYAFVVINALNLLPIYPLDGGQLLKTLFLGSRQLMANIFVITSIVLLVIYAVVNDEWFLLIIPYFLVTRLIQERQVARVRKELDLKQVNYHKTYGELSDAGYWHIRQVVLSENSALSKKIITDELVVSDDENEVISYIKSVLKNKPERDLPVVGIIIFMVLWISGIVLPLLLMTRIWEMI